MGSLDAGFRVVYSTKDEETRSYKGPYAMPHLLDYTANRRINIGLDQSTTQSGLAVSDAETDELLVVADITNLGMPSKQHYKEYLAEFLYENFCDATIDYFIYERPLDHSKDGRTQDILKDLELFIKRAVAKIPGLKDAKVIGSNNRVWRTHYLKDKRYQGRRQLREDVKQAAREECNLRFPWFNNQSSLFTSPCDSCDAVGLLYGSLAEMRSSFSRSVHRVNRTMEQAKGYKFEKEIFQAKPDEFTKQLESSNRVKNYGYELLEFNPSMSIEDNCKRYISNSTKVGILIVTDAKSSAIVKWESKSPLNPGEYYFIKTYRVNC